MRDRFWFIPMLLVLGGILVAVVVAHPEVVGLPRDWGLGSTVRTSTADTMLGVMSSSMLTFVGVVFAITLVGLQLASSQLSPRVIRTFVRSGVTKVAFGFFLATFAFAVTGLAMDEVDRSLSGGPDCHRSPWPCSPGRWSSSSSTSPRPCGSWRSGG